MKKILGALAMNKKIKINYETLKNYLNYEDVFYETVLMPFLQDNSIKHHFSGKYIILEFEDSKKEA